MTTITQTQWAKLPTDRKVVRDGSAARGHPRRPPNGVLLAPLCQHLSPWQQRSDQLL